MLGLARRPRRPGGSLEREVIGAVSILYVAICAMLLIFHYLAPRPAPGASLSSSPSPAHEGRR